MYLIIRTEIRITDGKFCYHIDSIEYTCKDSTEANNMFRSYVAGFELAEINMYKKIGETRSFVVFKHEWTETDTSNYTHKIEDIVKYTMHELV